jgi:4-hydroxy-tetrahydrodipicolinate reductase
MIRVIICGAGGRMGRMIATAVENAEGIEVSGGVEAPNSPYIGMDIGEIADLPKKDIKITSEIGEIAGDVIIEFSTPEATISHLKVGKKMVIGTTGIDEKGIQKIKEASKNISIVMSPNMSVGVNTLFTIVERIAPIVIKDFDVEIMEMHHRLKNDAPSGTAMKIAQIIAQAMGEKLEDVAVYGRKGMVGERKDKEIGILSLRGGDVVGEHTVTFAGIGERLEITHRAQSRETFAQGAVKAALWIINKPSGLYTMKNVLGL